MRFSSTKKDILFVLYQLELREMVQAIPATNLLEMINQSREVDFFATNFRTSCHTLHRNGFLSKYRNSSLKLAFTLTEQGPMKAAEFHGQP